MKKDTVVSIDETTATKDALTEVLREGAQQLLAEAVQAELEGLLEEYQEQRDSQGRRRLVRNDYLPKREIQSGIGGIAVRIPRGKRSWEWRGVRGNHPLSIQPGAFVARAWRSCCLCST